ncbi:MAG: type II toxin-antitoxin system RelE/ParE family toxin [Pyrinomonadaceae bacterium]
MTFEVLLMPSAKADIFEIRAWLMERDLDSADRWLWTCSQAITSLRKMPTRCPVSVETAAFDVEVREHLFGKKRNVYRILFSIQKDKVNVLRVRSTRQQRLIDKLDEE